MLTKKTKKKRANCRIRVLAFFKHKSVLIILMLIALIVIGLVLNYFDYGEGYDYGHDCERDPDKQDASLAQFYVNVIVPYIKAYLIVFLVATLVFMVIKFGVVTVISYLPKSKHEKKNKETKPKDIFIGEYRQTVRFIFFLIAAVIFLEAGIEATLIILGRQQIAPGLVKITLEAITAINVIGLHIGIEPFIMQNNFDEIVESLRKNILLYVLLAGNVILQIAVIILTIDILIK